MWFRVDGFVVFDGDAALGCLLTVGYLIAPGLGGFGGFVYYWYLRLMLIVLFLFYI